MLFVTDWQEKSSTSSADSGLISTIAQIAGVRAIRGYKKVDHWTLVMDVQDLTTVDRISADRICQTCFADLNITDVRAAGGMPSTAVIVRSKLVH